MIQAMDYFKYSGSSIRGLCHSMLSILHQIHIFDAQYLTPDTHLHQLQIHFFVNSRPGSTQPSPHASNCVSKPSLQDVHPSSLVAIDLPANGLRHLANTLAIQWGSWRLHKRRPVASNRLLNFTTNRGAWRW